MPPALKPLDSDKYKLDFGFNLYETEDLMPQLSSVFSIESLISP